jgi:hypothetical protein
MTLGDLARLADKYGHDAIVVVNMGKNELANGTSAVKVESLLARRNVLTGQWVAVADEDVGYDDICNYTVPYAIVNITGAA